MDRFPVEFQIYLIKAYEKKKQHRETVFEKKKNDQDTRATHYKIENTYCIKNKGIKDFVVKSSMQAFSRHLNRVMLTDERESVSPEPNLTAKNLQSPRADTSSLITPPVIPMYY